MLSARIVRAVMTTAFFCVIFSSAFAQPAIQLNPVVSGLSSPVLVTHAGDSRLFVVEQTGQIKIYPGTGSAVLATPFLDVDGISTCCGERGLLGLAFHPDYPATPFFFVHFTSDGDPLPDGVDPDLGDNVIVRYSVSGDPNVANPASGQTLLVMPNPFSNHNGGMIEFGPDGYLYIGKGDGGSSNDPGDRAQNINVLLGKVLRIDVDQNVGTPPYTAFRRPTRLLEQPPEPTRSSFTASGTHGDFHSTGRRATCGSVTSVKAHSKRSTR